jgi:hypothetical protein
MRPGHKIIFNLCAVIFTLLLAVSASAQISDSPRKAGEEILLEVITKPNKLIVRVGSNGCTNKNSFKVNVEKRDGLSTKSPHYVLTIVRTSADECKAIVEGGPIIIFDMEKDLGLTGHYTYSLTNRIYQNYNLIINEARIKNHRYYLNFAKKYIQLKDGKFKQEGSPNDYLKVELVDYLITDLDGNMTDDAVLVLATSPMGSGVFYELTTLISDTDDDFIRQSQSILLGDRIKLNSMSINDGQINLDMIVHKPGDPSCCPTKKIVKQFYLTDGNLREASK